MELLNPSATFDGADVSAYIVGWDRHERLCMPGAEWEVRLDLNYSGTINPWHDAVLTEQGTKVLTGYVASVSRVFGPDPHISVRGLDTWKRAMDAWVDTEYVTVEGDTVVGLIRKYMDQAGMTYVFDTDYNKDVPEGLVISYQPISELVIDLCSTVAFYITIDADGVVHFRVAWDTGPAIAEGDNLISIDVKTSDEKARNKVIVWGKDGAGIARSDESWAVVDHTMVYASPFIEDSDYLAETILALLKDLEIVKTCDVTGDATRRVGQKVSIDGPDGLDYTDCLCTSIHATYTQDSGYKMTAVHDERCFLFTGPERIGQDVIVATYDAGVWRCKNIWAASPHWESLNIGLTGTALHCEWFERDPFDPENHAFLLTEQGIYETWSLEPGEESWSVPNLLMLNANIGIAYGDTGALTWTIYKMKANPHKKGVYYVIVGASNDMLFFGMTTQSFHNFNGGSNAYGNYCPFMTPPRCYPHDRPTVLCYDPVGRCPEIHSSSLWGDGYNYGYEDTAAVTGWHSNAGYLTGGNFGGLAAWDRVDYGCTASGVGAPNASSGGPAWWHTQYPEGTTSSGVCGTDIDDVIESWTYPCICWWDITSIEYVCFRQPEATGAVPYNAAASWLKAAGVHVPHDQTYHGGDWSFPSLVYFAGGWDGDPSETTKGFPTKYVCTTATIRTMNVHGCDEPYVSLIGGYDEITNLPWGTDPDLLNVMSDSIMTHYNDQDIVYCWSGSDTSRFAVSLNGCDSWTEKDSVDFATGVFADYRWDKDTLFCGRDSYRDPATSTPLLDDYPLIYGTQSMGSVWIDVTGDLWTNTRDEVSPGSVGGKPRGALGLVTISPRLV